MDSMITCLYCKKSFEISDAIQHQIEEELLRAKLGYKDEEFDLIITSNAPVYLTEAARVLRHGGDIIVTYSFWGDAFPNAKNEISSLLNENGLHLINLDNIGKGVVIHGQK